MEKMKMQSPDGVEMNIDKIAALFPGCVTETEDEKGNVTRAVDFDLLRQELSADVVEGPAERYSLNWPGKREAIATANAPINKTLRPCREESFDFDSTENLYIEGDNLEALKLLQETYLGKVKMIYIDPPYNTGKDFIYSDNFTADKDEYEVESGQRDEEGGRLVANFDTNGRYHSDWLSMMYSRLKLARNLLKDDGTIFISIDDNEVHNLRRLCDEVFGEDNFIANIVWQKKTSPDARMNISSAHDHILLYGKQADMGALNFLPLEQARCKSFSNPDNDPRGVWASVDLTGQTGRAPKAQFYTITTPSGVKMPPPDGRCWALAEKTFNDLVVDKRIWFGKDGSNRPRLKKFLSESKGVRPWTWWDNKSVGHNQEGAQELKALFDEQTLFDNPKPTKLLSRIIQLSTTKNSGDIVLDFFSGSGTTAHAVFGLNGVDEGNRKVIIIQLPEPLKEGTNDYKANSAALKAGYKTIAEIGKERIRRAGKKIIGELEAKQKSEAKEPDLLTEQSATGTQQPAMPDIGFRVLKIESSNMNEVWYTPDQLKQEDLDLFTAHIKEDRTAEDLLFQVMLDWGVPLSAKIEKQVIDGKAAWLVNENDLLACFDLELSEETIKKMAAHKPLRAVFRDDAFDDSLKHNVEQLFKTLSPGTEVKSI